LKLLAIGELCNPLVEDLKNSEHTAFHLLDVKQEQRLCFLDLNPEDRPLLKAESRNMIAFF